MSHASDITIRPATNSDGLSIRDLCAESGFCMESEDGWEIDWSVIEPSWIVAEKHGFVIAALQMCLGKPVARLEMLVSRKSIGKIDKGIATKRLVDFGIFIARAYGSQLVAGVIPDEMKSYKQVALHRGYVECEHGSVMLKRIV